MITLEEVLSPENMQTACRRVIATEEPLELTV